MKKGDDEDNGDFGIMYKDFDSEMEGRMWLAANELAGYYMGHDQLGLLKLKKGHLD